MSLPLKVRIAVVLVVVALVAVVGVGLLGPWIGSGSGVEQKPALPQVTFVGSEPTPGLSPVESDSSSVISATEASSPTLRLWPNPASVPLNKTRETRIEINDVSQFYGVELRLTYNPLLLEVVDAEPDIPGVQVAPGTIFSEADYLVLKNEAKEGVINFVAGRQAPAPAFSGSGSLLNITWRGKATGEMILSFSEVKLADLGGQALPVAIEAAQVQIISELINVQGQVELLGGNPAGGLLLTIADKQTYTGPDGRFVASIEAPDEGEIVTIKAPGCLSVQITGLKLDGSNLVNLGRIPMVGGEVTGDEQIDGADITFISERYGHDDIWADLNRDGSVDIFDLTPTLANYGQRGPTQLNLGAEPPPVVPTETQLPAGNNSGSADSTTLPPASQSLPQTLATDYNGQSVQAWMQLLYDRVQADRLSPPVASRIYAYGGVTLYEAVVPGMPGYRSLQWQLNGLSDLPQPEEGPYHWPAVAASAMPQVTQALFTSPESQAAFQQLSTQQLAEATGVTAEVLERSKAHGQRLGEALVAWLQADGYEEIHTKIFTAPVGPERWFAVGEQQPLEPYWGELRPFVLPAASSCKPPAPETFSTDATSSFYAQARQVYDASRTLTAEQKAIVLFWADNPGETGTPPGHWVSIANQLIDQQQLNLGEAAHMHALLGIGLADAFISCWQAKYEHFLLRPASYIQQNIDPGWQSLISTPPFPEYTSGHSVASAAAAEILTGLFGPISFVDATHAGRELGTFTYNSFSSAAEEAAISRLYGGIHYPMAIENGLAQGRCVGQKVLERLYTR